MITPSDNDYKDTKKIKQGKKELIFPFKELAEWINKKYDVATLNIYYDLIEPKNSPRLNVILEFSRDAGKFKNGEYGNFDKEKQKDIAQKFEELITQNKIDRKGLFKRLLCNKENPRYDTKDIWVVVSSFENIARMEANESIPKERITELKNRINNQDLWEISRCFSYTTFFFFTDKQVKENQENGMKEKLTKEYFNLLKEYDEFDYFKEEYYSINFDSKENFDNNYQSNWYYYYK